MNITADAFLEKLQQKNFACPHTVVLWGEEAYYKKTVEQELRSRLFGPEEEPTVWNFKEQCSTQALEEAINTVPFFGGRNWVVVENPGVLQEKKKKDGKSGSPRKSRKKRVDPLQLFTALLSDVPDYSFVLCLCGKLDKRTGFYKKMSREGAVVECAPLRPYQMQPFLRRQAASHGSRFAPDALELMMDYLSAADPVPLLFVEQEINKIALYAGSRKIWQAEDVRQMFSRLPGISGFALSNAVEEGRLDRALHLLQEQKRQLGQDKLPLVLGTLAASVRRLLLVREMGRSAPDVIAGRLKMHPFAVRKAMENNRRFSEEQLENCLNALADAAVAARQGGDGWTLLEEIIIELLHPLQ